ncbi:hypothetical protein [Foetidibacter luteolus]|uniref:hypothetical protein n=1 Tax=Foetidibacter luteolus TaxID=2608880 RepID=UPI00129B4399|nr:hypothetical protein [Foetidibacter luteolus]
MEKLTFQQLNILCDLNADKKYVRDCLQVLRHEDCIFENGIIMPRDHIASLYSFRFNSAKDAGNLKEDYLLDFKNCVDELNKSESDLLGITSVYGDNISFLIFFEPDSKTILGLLKSKSPSGIKSIEQNATDTINRGFSSNAEKYSKGAFVRDWK